MNSQPYLQAHCQSHTSQGSNQSFIKELVKPTLKKEKKIKHENPTRVDGRDPTHGARLTPLYPGSSPGQALRGLAILSGASCLQRFVKRIKKRKSSRQRFRDNKRNGTGK